MYSNSISLQPVIVCLRKSLRLLKSTMLPSGLSLAQLAVLGALSCAGLMPVEAQMRVEPSTHPAVTQKASVSYQESPLAFEANHGQLPSQIRYAATGPGYAIRLEQERLVLELNRTAARSSVMPGGMKTGAMNALPRPEPPSPPAATSVELRLLNANKSAPLTPSGLTPAISNYYPGRDPSSWHMKVPSYGQIAYSGIYPGIDLVFYGQGRSLEYDFRVKAGADAGQISLGIGGVDQARIDDRGRLTLEAGGRVVEFLKPIGYQVGPNGARQSVAVDYRLTLDRSAAPHSTGTKAEAQWLLSFAVGPHDVSRDVVIDPVLSYGSELSNLQTNIGAIAVDGTGNTYISGQAQGNGFYVNEYNNAGGLLVHTVVGAGINSYPTGLAVDAAGKAYVVGFALGNLPTTANAYQTYTGNRYQPFVVVIPAAGGAPTYLSYLGGGTTAYDYASGIAVDSTGKFYITGYESSTNFPTTAGAYQTTNPGSGSYSAFVAKFNPAASGAASLVYSTYLDGTGIASYAGGIAVDSGGSAYVAVQSNTGYPVTAGAYTYTGSYSDTYSQGAYVTKLNPTGTALTYSAYLGPGTSLALAVDTNGDAYAVGAVQADDFPVTTGAYQTTYPGGFVTELNPAGTALVYSTFLSGPSGASNPASNNIIPQSIALARGCSSACAAYVSGYTISGDLPAINAIQSTANANGSNALAFVVALNGNGSGATYSTYLDGILGGVTYPYGAPLGSTPSIAVDSSGNAYLAVNVNYGDFPTTLPPATTSGIGYVAKISPTAGGNLIASPLTLNFDNYIGTGVAVGVSSTLSGVPVPLVLRNLGSTAVTISSITFTPATEFSETDTCAGTIPAGGTCTLNLAFTPAGAGKRTATLAVNSNAVVTPVSVALSGTGVAAGYLQVSAPLFTFGDQTLGTTSPVQSITITNIGKTLVNLQAIALSGVSANQGNGSDFQALDNCPAQLLPAASCTVGATFTPVGTGLRSAGFYLQGDGFGNQQILLHGEGLATGSQGTVSLSATLLNFNTQLVNTLSPRQTIVLTNTSSIAVTIYSVSVATSGQTGISDYSIYNGSCQNANAFQIQPQATCTLNIAFTPSSATYETGTVTFNDSATGSPHVVNLTGSGLAASQALEFTPGSSVFPDQPVGLASAVQTFYVYNTSTAPVTIDRLLTTGDFSVLSSNCPGIIVKPGPAAGVEPTPGCSVRVVFTPTATGMRAGTLTFVDAAGSNPQVLNLTGNGITATGALFLEPAALTYPVQAVGTTSTNQTVVILNPGNSPITINNVTTTGDYAIASACSTFPFVLGPGRTCSIQVSFTPTSTTNPRSGSVVVTSSAGTMSTTLTGTGVTSTIAVGLTPTSLNFGNVQTTTSNLLTVYIRNAGTDAVTLTSIANTGAAFTSSAGSCGFYSNLLLPGTSCYVQVTFSPTATGTQTGVLTLVDSAGTQTVNFTGVGVSAYTAFLPRPSGVAYDQLPVGSSSNSVYVTLQHYGAGTVMVKTAAISAGGSAFVIPVGGDNCSGVSLSTNACTVQVQFSPTVAGNQSGTLTFTDATNATYNVGLAGYAEAVSTSAYLDPTRLAFPGQVITTLSNQQAVVLRNASDVMLTVGTLTGTNTIVGTTTTGAFSTNGAQGGNDGCSGVQIAPRSACGVNVVYAPTATGSAVGTLVFPVTYANGTTASFTANFTGTGLAIKDSAELSPATINFQDQTVGAVSGAGADATQAINLYNSGNLPMTIGVLTGTNVVIGSTLTGDFTTASAFAGFDGCTNQVVSPKTSCQVTVGFNPAVASARTGTIHFPVTYGDHTTTTVSASLTGKGVTANSKIVVSPGSGQFDVQVVGTTSDSSETLTFNVTDTGNLPVKITTSTVTSNFSFVSDSCSGTTLAINTSCQIILAFSPTTTGNINGTLTIPDNAAGSPHKVYLSGTGIAASQQIVLSQTVINFPNQVVSTRSGSVYVTVNNQSGSTVPVTSAVLGGANPTDFLLSDGCSGQSISGHSNCTLSVQFAPGASSLGVRTAKITETDAATGSPRVITLSGTGIVSGPAVALYPASLNFGSVVLNTVSPPLTFSVTNTGSATLNITGVASTNATEFPIKTNGCTGTAVAPGANCLVSVTFNPNAGSTQSASITITSNAPGSPHSLPVSGLSVGIPAAALAPTSLTFGSQGVGVASATQTITLSNGGTDTLNIASIAIGGTNAGDFKQTNTCGSSIVAKANCTISVIFTPTALGSRSATVTVTDNAGNTAGSQQSATLSGTGTGVEKISFSPTSLTFASTHVGSSTASQNVTVSNPGSAPLTITSISISPVGDFTQTNNCVSPLAVGSTCTVSVTFTPSAAGARTASINFTDGAAGSPQTVSLSGTGIGVAQASLSTNTLSFGNQAIGVMSSAMPVTLTNTGSGSLIVTLLKIAGTNPGDFAETSTTCPGTLAPSANCVINVTFKPTVSGARSATLTITDNNGNVTGSTQSVSLSGTGAGTPQVSFNPGSFTFGSDNVGTSVGPQKVIASNTGNGPLSITSIALSGADPGDFTEFDTCQPSLPAGGTCEIALYFRPGAAGSRTANVVLTDNANNVVGATQTLTVTGTGTGAPTASLSVTSLAFGTVHVGTQSNGQFFSLANTGNTVLNVASVTVTGTNAADYSAFQSCTPTVSAGSDCTVVVFFKPTATGTRTAAITITDNSNNVSGAVQTVTLSGTGN